MRYRTISVSEQESKDKLSKLRRITYGMAKWIYLYGDLVTARTPALQRKAFLKDLKSIDSEKYDKLVEDT
jgi:hypothetical protein